jgi:hypothetical protein
MSSCDTAATPYNIDGTSYVVSASLSEDDKEVCRATQILERLHKDLTDKHYTTADKGTDEKKTLVGTSDSVIKPSYYLRSQPRSNTDSTDVNRFYENKTNSLADNSIYRGNPYYRKMISVIMKGSNDESESSYNTAPPAITGLTDFNSPNDFKGIYGLNRVIELLETKINTILKTLIPSSSSANASAYESSGSAITRYDQRKEIKNTLEEIAYRENQLYREKFLNVILLIVGIFLVGSQLVQSYFSGGVGGGASGSAGLGGLFGFGLGGGGGLFSRFGGLGLGSSGRSHFDIGNLFKKSSYTLEQR